MAGKEHAGAQFDEHFNRIDPKVSPDDATYDIRDGMRYTGVSVIHKNEHTGKVRHLPGEGFYGEEHGVWGSGKETDPAVDHMRRAKSVMFNGEMYHPSHVNFEVPNPEAPNGSEKRSHFMRNSPRLNLSKEYPGPYPGMPGS